MKVVVILTGRRCVNCSRYLHSLWQISVVADVTHAEIYKSSGCLKKNTVDIELNIIIL